MAAAAEFCELSNRVRIPSIGFGAWQIENGNIAVPSVAEALKCGYLKGCCGYSSDHDTTTF